MKKVFFIPVLMVTFILTACTSEPTQITADIYAESGRIGQILVEAGGNISATFDEVPQGLQDVLIQATYEDPMNNFSHSWGNISFTLEQGTHVGVILPLPSPYGETFILCPKEGGACK